MTSSPRKSAVSFRAVATGLAVLLVLAGLIGAFGYFRYLAYDRVAALHLPGDTSLALRIDVEKVVLYDPVRKHLLPLVDELGAKTRGTRMGRLKDRAGIEIGADLRELVVARGQFENQWLLVLGGRFPKQGVVDGLADVLAEEGQGVRRLASDQLALASGIAIGQADDGAIIVADSAERMQSALPARSTHQSLGIERTGSGSFSIDGRLLRPLSALSTFAAPGLGELGKVKAITGTFRLGAGLTVDARIALSATAGATTLEERGRALVRALGQFSRLLVDPTVSVALERADVTAAGPDELRVVIPFQKEQLDQSAQALAAGIRSAVRGTSHLIPPVR